MKIDIKSFLIGVLTTVNLFLLMGFDDHEKESQIGRYQLQINERSSGYIIDTTNGKIVKTMNVGEMRSSAKENPIY